MRRRFQFSLKTIIASTAIAAVGFACLAFKGDLQFIAIIGGCTAIGAAAGLPFRFAPPLAVLGFVIGVAAAFYFVTLSIAS